MNEIAVLMKRVETLEEQLRQERDKWEERWRGMQETIYLLSIPEMRESIKEGMATPVEACVKELDW